MKGRKALLERLIRDNPQFHKYRGAFTSWAVHPDTLRFLHRLLSAGMSTLETGCGHTTIVFSMVDTKHTCITPDPEEAGRIKRYCAQLGLAENVTFVVESSDVALPRNERMPAELDCVFIDGAHRFPFPILDWHYTADRLKVGGIVGVDDFNMPSVQILYNFLCVEEEWELIKTLHNTAFFRKLRDPDTADDWQRQRINATYRDGAKYPKRKPIFRKLSAQRPR